MAEKMSENYVYPRTTYTRGKNKGKKIPVVEYAKRFYDKNKELINFKIRTSDTENLGKAPEKKIKRIFMNMVKENKQTTAKKTLEKVSRKEVMRGPKKFFEDLLIGDLKKAKLLTRYKDPKTGRFKKVRREYKYLGTVTINNNVYRKYLMINFVDDVEVSRTYVYQILSPKEGMNNIFTSNFNYE